MINKQLAINSYLATDHISIADINLFVDIRYAFRFFLGKKSQKDFPNLTRWYRQIGSLKPII